MTPFAPELRRELDAETARLSDEVVWRVADAESYRTRTTQETTMNLDFETLREANAKRCAASFHAINDWSPTDWACAMAGEAGEACNEVKKLRRISDTPEALAAKRNVPSMWSEDDYAYSARVQNVGGELADIVIYADLLAARLGLNLADCVSGKFNEVSERVGSDVRLPEPEAAV